MYIISNVHSGKRLAVADGGQNNGDKMVQDDNTKTHVTWRLEKVGDGYFHVVNTSSGLVLDMPHDHAEKAGERVQQWEAKDDGQHSNQAWEFVEEFGEHYAIRCKLGGVGPGRGQCVQGRQCARHRLCLEGQAKKQTSSGF